MKDIDDSTYEKIIALLNDGMLKRGALM